VSRAPEGSSDLVSGKWLLPSILEMSEAVEETSPADAMATVQGWLGFLQGEGKGAAAVLADASGYPLEEALELFQEELSNSVSVVVAKLPAGVSGALGPVGLLAAIRNGEDLDLSLFGGQSWETVHLDFLATNPLIGWASEVWDTSGLLRHRLRAAATAGAVRDSCSVGVHMLQSLLASAASTGRAVTVAPINEQNKEQYRQLGFWEDSLVDPTLMFWVPTEE
ncbi:unnamed protein product, partial [Polarella glacialis]